MVISNQAYGIVRSDYIGVLPSTSYRMSAWLRGEIVFRYATDANANAEESYGGWILRPVFYDANLNYLGYVNASSSNTVSSGWSEQGGNFTTPANAAYVKLELYDYMTSGWVAFDDVRLTVVNPSVVTRKNYYVTLPRFCGQGIKLHSAADGKVAHRLQG